MGWIESLWYRIAPLSSSSRGYIQALKTFGETDDLSYIRQLFYQKKMSGAYMKLGVSSWLIEEEEFIQLHPTTEDKEVLHFCNGINGRIKERMQQRLVKSFGQVAKERFPQAIAPQIEGMDMIKLAVVLQLVSKDAIHILLLGDPGTGKTDIIRTASELHEKSSYGLGSGTSGVGLTVAVKGKEISKGLLPMAHEGVCALDELNLLKDKDVGALYNAMEKGFVTYRKGGKDLRFKAQVRLLATANPKGDRFVGKGLSVLKDQIPFESALLSRFHLTFFVRAPNVKKFVAITKRIITGSSVRLTEADIEFLRAYISYAEDIEVELGDGLQEKIVEYVKQLKEHEKKYLVEISPRVVHGIVRLVKAHARLQLRRKALDDDLDAIKRLVTTSLEVVV